MPHGREPGREEIYISVDVEAAGPIPGEYSMLSLGACLVHNLDATFYVELQPINDNAVPQALAVSGFSLEQLRATGRPPAEAMRTFRDWIASSVGDNRPVFVAFNATFDWSFVNWYFHKYVGANPFGISGLDIKAYYMGLSGCRWGDTTKRNIPKQFHSQRRHTHNALDDALGQAEMFAKMLEFTRPA